MTEIGKPEPLAPEVIAALTYVASLDWRTEPDTRTSVLEGVQDFGSYEGLPARIELLADGRNARLLAPISYRDPKAASWPVPSGADLDGASIPRALWPIIGGPFEGRYRDASIVHDHYCDEKSRPWQDTHRMFYSAMRCSGVAGPKAKIMFYAVYRFGPRWGDGLEGTEAAQPRFESLNGSSAPSFALDAEAIVTHDLTIAEIEALAQARAPSATGGAAAEGTVEVPTRARLLSIVGGTGDSRDLEAIVGHAVTLPDYVLARFEKKGVRFVACRDNVTDFETSLRGKIPRGWEATGKSWDDVPGAYLPDRKRVVVATIAGDQDGRLVPTKSTRRHGSADLLVHEALHGYDFAMGHSVLSDPVFAAARNADFARLDTYEQQGGDAGLQETFAESGARYFVEPDLLATTWPNLHGYWERGPSRTESAGVVESVIDERAPIGTIERLDGGAFVLDLRADGPGGVVGHAQFVLVPGDPTHAGIEAKMEAARLEGTLISETGVQLFYP